MPKLLIELRDDPAVDAIVAGRVVGKTIPAGYQKGAGEFVAFLRLTTTTTPRLPGFIRGPVQAATITCQAYAATDQAAFALYMACVNALHDLGPRIHSNGLAIYNTFDITGGSQEQDPDTAQPYVEFVISALATTQAVTT